MKLADGMKIWILDINGFFMHNVRAMLNEIKQARSIVFDSGGPDLSEKS